MISIKNIFKSYRQKQVLNNLTFDVENGQIQVVIGVNGSGKTTLINILSSILKQDGGVWKIGSEVLGKNETNVDIGYVLETPIYIDKFSAYEYLQFISEIRRTKNYKGTIVELLEKLDLPTNNKVPICEYSKGMKSKVSLAAALLHNPSYLILDEPFDGIDFLSLEKIFLILKSLSKQGVTVLISSHQNIDLLMGVCTKFALLHKGNIAFNLSRSELMNKSIAQFGSGTGHINKYIESQINNE